MKLHLYTPAAILVLVMDVMLLPTLARAETPRCEIVPLAGHQVSLRIDGEEKTRWHYGKQYPRPFFFPFNGPSGESLTRMGHPGAPNHDHHRSVWFAHHDVNGQDFWSNETRTTVQQTDWMAYRDADDEAIMAVSVRWYDADGKPLLDSSIYAALAPEADGHRLELQLVVAPASGVEKMTLGKTNFGFLAVRMAKSISAHFGDGVITSSEGAVGEEKIFGKRARWMDYSGPIAVGKGKNRRSVVEGVTYFDHPSNPNHPSGWHVRKDGWMGAGFCLFKPYELDRDNPLTLRYLLHAHSGKYDAARAKKVFEAFTSRPSLELLDGKGVPHHQFIVQRVKPAADK